MLLSMQGQKDLGFHKKYLKSCTEDEWRSYGFGMTRGWVINNRSFLIIFGRTILSSDVKATVHNFFVQNLLHLYNKRVHHESIFQTVFLACPESLRYTYNKCLYSDYFRLVWVGTAAEYPVPAWFVIDMNREK